MSDVSNLSDTIVPRSDQLNSESLLGGPMTITVTEVRRGTDEQPVVLHYQGDDGRPYKPCKTCRKVLIFAWGDDGREWIGRSMTLFNNPDVKFGGVKVGGIRISHLSHIERDIAMSLTATKGKKESYTIKKLGSAKPAAPAPSTDDDLTAIRECDTLDQLRSVFTAAQKSWKAAGIDIAPLVAAKDEKKAQLEQPSEEVI